MYPIFLDLGYTPQFFWDISLQEIYELIESKNRIRKIEEEKEKNDLKTRIIINSILARQIAENVSCLFSKDTKVSNVYELMPELFKEELEQLRKEQAEEQWKLHKARFMMFSEEHNRKRERKEE